MLEDKYNEMIDPEDKKGHRSLWILLAVVAALVLCSYCVLTLSAIIASVIAYSSDLYYDIAPWLSLA